MRFLDDYLAKLSPAVPPGLPRFFGGAVGWLGYDIVRSFERLPSTQAGRARAARALLRDHRHGRDVRQPARHGEGRRRRSTSATARDPGRAYDDACARIEAVLDRLARPAPPLRPLDPAPAAAAARAATRPSRARRTRPASAASRSTSSPATRSRWSTRSGSRSRAATSIRSTSTARCGSSTRRRTCSTSSFPRRWSPAPRRRCWCGWKTARSRCARSRARAGAAPPPRRTPRSRPSCATIRRSCAEHMMLIDLGRNDVGRVSVPGTVPVDGADGHRALLARHAPGVERARPRRAGHAPRRRGARGVPGRHALRRAEDPRDGDHRGAGAGAARDLRRRGRLHLVHGQHGPRDRDPDAGRQAATPSTCRRARASSPTASRPRSTRSASTRRAPCSAPSRWRGGAREAPCMLLVIDNYDSFTYNLVQYLGELGQEVRVVRNDEIAGRRRSRGWRPRSIVISPGPCTPNEAGICLDVIKTVRGQDPDPRRLPGPPVDRAGVRRQDRARRAASCTARRRRSTTTARASSPGCPTRSRRRATTRW